MLSFVRVAVVGASMIVAGAATAQDFGGSVISSTIGTEGIRSATEEAGRGRVGRTNRQGLSPRAAGYCANKASARARFGADDPRVRDLYRLCREAGR